MVIFLCQGLGHGQIWWAKMQMKPRTSFWLRAHIYWSKFCLSMPWWPWITTYVVSAFSATVNAKSPRFLVSVDVPNISRRSAVISEATSATVRCVVAFTNFTGGGHDEQLQYVHSYLLMLCKLWNIVTLLKFNLDGKRSWSRRAKWWSFMHHWVELLQRGCILWFKASLCNATEMFSSLEKSFITD